MRILFQNGDYPFCYYYRGFLPGVYSGQMVVKDYLNKLEQADQSKIAEQMKQADVVVFQRPNNKASYDLIQVLKRSRKKVIFENDDSYKINKAIDLSKIETDKQKEIAKNLSDYTDKIIKLCDGVIASTEFLAEEYKELNPNVAVLKNCIDPLDEYKCKNNETGKFRIGLIGSVTTNDDYLHIKDQLKELDKRDDITLVVMGAKYRDGSLFNFMKEDAEFWGSFKNIEWHPYCYVLDYMRTLSQLALDLAIIPRKDNYFNRCKSNLKFLEMSLLGIPVIAQGFSDGRSPYEQDKEHLILAYDNWLDEILKVKDNYSEYKKKSQKAKEYVLENYNIKSYAQEWVKEIERLCK